MPNYDGYLPYTNTWTERVGQIKGLFSNYLSGVFTLNADAGTDYNRVLQYMCPHTNRIIKFVYPSSNNYSQLYLYKLNSTSDVIYSTQITGYAYAIHYQIIVNENSGVLLFNDSTNKYPFNLVWGTLGDAGFCSVNGRLFQLTGDNSLWGLSYNVNPNYSYLLSDESEVFLPVFIPMDDNVHAYKTPAPDIFTFTNSKSVAIGQWFTVGSNSYLVINNRLCMRVN